MSIQMELSKIIISEMQDQQIIVLKEVDEDAGKVTVELVGACGTCPISTQTMKAGIERILRDRVEGVTEVVRKKEQALVVNALVTP